MTIVGWGKATWVPCEVCASTTRRRRTTSIHGAAHDPQVARSDRRGPRRVAARCVSRRGAAHEGQWHWAGMSDSEDDDWRSDDTDELAAPPPPPALPSSARAARRRGARFEPRSSSVQR